MPQMVKTVPAMQESLKSGSGRSPGEGNGYPLQYSCLKNSMDRGAWWATVHGVRRVGLDSFINFISFFIYLLLLQRNMIAAS